MEQENARLKRIVAEQALDISMLKDLQGETRRVEPARTAVGTLVVLRLMATRARSGRPLRILNVVHEYTRECITSYVASSIGAREVVRVLELAFADHTRR